MKDENRKSDLAACNFENSIREFTPPLDTEQKIQLDSHLLHLNESLKSALKKLDKLHEPLTVHKDADLFKQPESNLLAYVQQLTASATANVLDILETLPAALNTAQTENQELLSKLSEVDNCPEKLTATIKELQDHLNNQNRMMQSMSIAHSDILNLHSFQDLTSQAVIRAESFVDEIKSGLEDAHKSLSNFSGLSEDTEEVQPTHSQQLMQNTSQLDQSDVDSLFASFKN